ncbi:MAG TPA: isoprenylcysteine carboxylmethyltransferase family protein [Methylomirabilota bacterium]|nr:isoprenylcysteine carboxylmethyltransferase family protein [Methylomirabilota bacterium]
MNENAADRPNRIPWPPLILVTAVLAAWGVEVLVPTGVPVAPAAGWIIVAIALAIDVWAMVTMVRSRTNILPHRPADALVTSGPFAWSRNPIYLGNTLLLFGLSIAFDTLWLAAAAAIAAVAVHWLAIRREERHLAARFGDAWHRYAAVTPRWLGVRGGRR